MRYENPQEDKNKEVRAVGQNLPFFKKNKRRKPIKHSMKCADVYVKTALKLTTNHKHL